MSNRRMALGVLLACAGHFPGIGRALRRMVVPAPRPAAAPAPAPAHAAGQP